MRDIAAAIRVTEKVAPDELNNALDLFGETEELWKNLVSLGLITEEEIFIAVANYAGLEYVDLGNVSIDDAVITLLPSSFCRKELVLPIGVRGDHLFLAISDPSNIIAIDDVASLTDLRVAPKIVSPSILQQSIDRYLRSDEELSALTEALGETAIEEEAADDLEDDDFDAPVVRFVNILISQAIQDRASDIHVEPGAKELKVRFRIDGVLHEMQKAERGIQAGILSRLKIMADIDIAEKRKPQDGRMSVQHQGKTIDIRVASLPTVWGEKIIMRILDHDSGGLSLDKVGMSEENLAKFRESIQRSHGMVLVTGPTGSGKALRLDTKIPTPTGWTTMGDISVGDVVLDSKSESTLVTGVSPMDENPDLYRLTLSDGQKIFADGNHQWIVAPRGSQNDSRALGVEAAEKADVLASLYEENEFITLAAAFEQVEVAALNSHVPSNGALLATLRYMDAEVIRDVTPRGTHLVVDPHESFALLADRLRQRYEAEARPTLITMSTSEMIEAGVKYENKANFSVPLASEDNKGGGFKKWLYIMDIAAVSPDDVDYGAVRCITVDSPDSSYLCENYVVTHNSTTLYTTLDEVANSTVNVITVEDPVERRIEGVNQVQINNKAGLTFPAALRSILRSDPDIVLIGEIRDKETAMISVEASLTGHLVLSTLHTNDAPSAMTRLVEMGVESYLVSTALSCIVAQRLARKLCEKCKTEVEVNESALEKLEFPKVDGVYPKIYKHVGCSTCSMTGYRGRLALLEVMAVTERIERLTVDRASSSEMRRAAEEEGLVSLRQDGWRRVIAGVTTIEEVLRVAA